jgi:hypothetical protein
LDWKLSNNDRELLLKGFKMLKKFVRSALCILCIATATFSSVSAIADTEVNFNTTHVYPTAEVDKESLLDALSPLSSIARWNYLQPLGTPVTIYYGFMSPELGQAFQYDLTRNFYSYEKTAVIDVLDHISSLTGITFVEKTTIAQKHHFEEDGYNIVFGITSEERSSRAGGSSREYYSTNYILLSEESVFAYLNPNREVDYIRIDERDIDYKHDHARSVSEILYQIVSTLGFLDSGRYDITDKSFIHRLSVSEDNQFYTVMSPNNTYLPYSDHFFRFPPSHQDYSLALDGYLNAYSWPSTSEMYAPTTLKKYDVLVLQHIYGKAENTNTGDTLYTYDDAYDFHQLIYDVDGIDTLNLAESTRNNIIDLRSGAFSSIAPNSTGFYDKNVGGEHLNRSHNNLSIAYDVVIENAVGGKGDDILVANSTANMLDGGDGIDTAMFVGNKADYTIETINDYTIEVTSISDGDDIDNLVDFEFIQFADETMVINKPPVVTMPETIIVREGLQAHIAVTVTQPDNDVHSYTWTQLDGIELTLENADNLNVNFVAPAVDVQETINLQLVVSDGTNIVANTLTVVVIPNAAPVITDVTADQTVNERTAVTLTVAATDADNDTLTYRWVVNGATVTLTGSTTETVTFTAPDVTSATNLTVQVFVTDGFDEISSEIRTITVNNIDTTPDPVVTSPKKESSGGSFGYLILLIAGLRLFRK